MLIAQWKKHSYHLENGLPRSEARLKVSKSLSHINESGTFSGHLTKVQVRQTTQMCMVMPTKCLHTAYTLRVFWALFGYFVWSQVLRNLGLFLNVTHNTDCVFIAKKKPKRLISSSPGNKIQHISNCNQNKQGTDSEFSLEGNKCNFRVWERNLLEEMVCVTAFTRCTFHCQLHGMLARIIGFVWQFTGSPRHALTILILKWLLCFYYVYIFILKTFTISIVWE